MKASVLKYVIAMAVVAVSGILLVQLSILKNAYDISERQFQERAQVALREVAWQLLAASGETHKFDSVEPVDQVSSHYFFVNVNSLIDPEILRYQLTEQLKRHNILLDFEYAIFDSQAGRMTIKEFVCMRPGICDQVPMSYFPRSDRFVDYFAVNFPSLAPYLNLKLRGWYLMTALLLLVLAFFGYSLWAIGKQRRLSATQKIFINNLTHELKTPVSSIHLAAKVISHPDILQTPERLFRYSRIIDEQSSRLTANIEKVLNVAMLDKRRVELATEKVEINRFVSETLESFRLSEYGNLSTIRFTPLVPEVTVVADPMHLENILQNMIENCIKYCTAHPDITVSLKLDKNRLRLSVADNGIGIPLKFRRKIFKKFYRIPTGDVHNVKGFGIGLNYVYKMVKAHKWGIEVDDNPGGGTIFTLIIPVDYAHR